MDKLLSFTYDGTLVAISDSNAIIKFWDAHSGFLEHEFQPAEYLSAAATCIKFSPKNAFTKKNQQKRVNGSTEQLLAIGTMEGSILVYNFTKREVTAKLQHSSSQVTDICWNTSSELISISRSNTLIYWNVYKKSKVREFEISGSSSLGLLGKNSLSVSSNDLYFLKFTPKTNEKKEFKLVGPKTSILQSVPIFLDEEKEARYVLTVAENDRFVYAWSTNWEQIEPVASFMVKDIVKSISCVDLSKSSIGLCVCTRKGQLKYFTHHLNGYICGENVQPHNSMEEDKRSIAGNRYEKEMCTKELPNTTLVHSGPESNTKKEELIERGRRSKPIKSVGSLKILTKSNKESLSIMGTYFLSRTTTLFVYGTDLFPRCERILIEELIGDVVYIRKDPSLFSKKKSGLIKTVIPHITNESVHLMPTQTSSSEIKEVNKRKKGDATLNLPMEERLDSLSLTKSYSSSTKGRPFDNCVHLLVQALRSKDSLLLSNILLKGEEAEEIIHSTVKMLPVGCVVPFLQYLQEVIAGKGIKNLSFITWIKSVFYHHMSHLSSIPDKETLMQPFYVVCSSRTTTLPTITKLHSRINLLLTHVKTRHDNAIQKAAGDQNEALLIYKEESSDDEDLNLGLSGLHSESEDNFDFLTEDDDEEEEEDNNDHDINGITDDENEPPLNDRQNMKRKKNESMGINENDAIAISENEDNTSMENDDVESLNDEMECDNSESSDSG